MIKLLRNTALSVLATVASIPASFAVTSEAYSLTPLSLTQESSPLVMLAMSRDHQLFYKAYPDYTDLDGDGKLDTQYLDTFDYAGYFNSGACYDYDATNKYFKIAAEAKHNVSSTRTVQHSCIDAWSGNFLNWVSMTRMDVLRHVLYGGKRVVDDASATKTVEIFGNSATIGRAVLERSYLPNDVHSFGKVYPVSTEDNGQIPLSHLVPTAFSTAAVKTDTDEDWPVGVENGLTICSATNDDSEPVLRIVSGLYPSWMIKEKTVCTFDGESGAPSSDVQVSSDMVIKVEVCANERDLTTGRCQYYRNADSSEDFFKPVGLLQKFGEDGRLSFGLITGSWHRNTDGGVVRSEIHKIAGNVDASGNPVNSKDEINLKTGAFNALPNGIISNLEQIEISQKPPGSSNYADCNTPLISIDSVKSKTNASRSCSDWGNPIAEIYYEALRYFSGKGSALGDFANDMKVGNDFKNDYDYKDGVTGNSYASDYLSGMNTEFNWTDPLNSVNYCSKCSIILISSGPASFDNNVVDFINGDVVGLDNADALRGKTNTVGDFEYGFASGKKSFIAEKDGFCVKKEIGLGSADGTVTLSQEGIDANGEGGLCPDSPQTQGSYHIAGLTYHATSTDLRADYIGRQTINTYAIELSDSVPTIDFQVLAPDPLDSSDKISSKVTLVPACQSKSSSLNAYTDADYTYCALTEIRVLSSSVDASNNLKYASFIVSWENSVWGSDHDMDGVERIDICTNLSERAECTDLADGEIKIAHQIVYSSLGNRLRASYAITGTTEDGLFRSWSVKNEDDATQSNFDWETLDDAPKKYEKVFKVNAGGDAVPRLATPLYLAAKYGGFKDVNNNKKPDLAVEWDRLDNETGLVNPDGIPDNYYKVRNPTTLEKQLTRVFNSIVARVASGSNAAVVANRASGNGAIYQAVYYPQLNEGNDTVAWTGRLHSLFVDNAGLIREDSNGNGRLDDYPVRTDANNASDGDFIVQIYYDEDSNDTFIQRYALWESGVRVAVPFGNRAVLTDLDPIWDAANELANLTDAEVISQRTYADDVGRHILTSYEKPCTDDVTKDCVETIAFTKDNAGLLKGSLGIADTNVAETIIDYVRGKDSPSYRSRKLGSKTMRLGDIIHSTPVIMDKVSGRYDSSLGDSSYLAFANKYKDRRRVVFVGANDGLIHAFNGGYWNSLCNGFFRVPVTDSDQSGSIEESECATAENSILGKKLGSELWAYAPMNLLPHLKWLAEPSYAHVFYVDGEPELYDVRIWQDEFGVEDTLHPNGWGTILVVPMRQGGGEISVDHDSNATTAPKTYRSAIVVLDVTDPNQAPKLIAEITDENLGFTIGKPTLVREYKPSVVTVDANGNYTGGGTYTSPGTNRWHLVFGSGPYPIGANNQAVSTSTQSPYLYSYDLVNRTLYKNATFDDAHAITSSFFTNFAPGNWDRNGTDEVVYFGSVTAGVADQSGMLHRWRLDQTGLPAETIDQAQMKPTIMLKTESPIVSTPILTRSAAGDRWIHFGTGRFYIKADRSTDKKQKAYGITEPRDPNSKSFTWAQRAITSLVDVTDIHVTTETGAISDENGNTVKIGTTNVADFDALKPIILGKGGWSRDLTYSVGSPAGRVLREGAVYQDQYIFTEYIPSADQCDINGRSNLYSISWETGTALPYAPLGNVGTTTEASVSTDLGVGEFSGVTVFETSNYVTLAEPDDETGVNDILLALENGASASDYEVSEYDENCVFVQSSTGEMICRRAGTNQINRTGRQSWREIEILF